VNIRSRLWRRMVQRCAELSHDDGSSAIELALLAPALIIITMLVIQWALWFQARQVALDSAQAGARVAREQEPGWPAQSVAEARKFYNEVGSKVITGISATVNPAGGAPNQVYVTVTGDVPTLIPGISTLQVHETAGGDVECFRPADEGGNECANG
jgi:Flp pilus assembly protein TadG